MVFIYNFGPSSYYYNTFPYMNNLQVYLYPKSYTGSGSTWDNVQNSTEATLFNNPTYNSTTGFTFNGTTQYGSLPSVSGITDFTSSQDYTVECWININSTQVDTGSPDNSIVEKWNSSNQASYPYVIRWVRASSSIRIATYNGSLNPVVDVPSSTNVWQQIVGVFDHTNNLLSFYKNGVFITSVAMNITGVNNNGTLNLGRRANSVGGGLNYFTGSIGILRIYSEALNSQIILQNYNANKSNFGLS